MRSFSKLILCYALFFSCAATAGEAQVIVDPVLEWHRIEAILDNPRITPDWRDSRGYSAAYYRLVYGSENSAAKLISTSKRRGAWVEGNGERLLEIAIRLGSQEVVAALLKRHEPANSPDKTGFSPVQLASALGRLEIARMLLKNGADPRCPTCLGRSPIEMALSNGHWQTALLLHAYGADLAKYRERKNESELIFRALDGKTLESLDVLIKLGFDINTRNSSGESTFEYAVKAEVPDRILEALILYKVDLCAKTSSGGSYVDLLKKQQTTSTMPHPFLDEVGRYVSNCGSAARPHPAGTR